MCIRDSREGALGAGDIRMADGTELYVNYPFATELDSSYRNPSIANTYVPDFLTGKKEKNRGRLEMYLVENAHEPIIDQKTFNRVQEMKGHIKHAVQMEQML